MRTIDADDLMDTLKKCGHEAVEQKDVGQAVGVAKCILCVRKAPTVRKTGEWLDKTINENGIPTESCSVCRTWSYGYNENFCPVCGAEMRCEDGGIYQGHDNAENM